MDDSIPLACALSTDAKQRRFADTGALFALAEQRTELADGYAFRFPAAQAADVLAFVEAERECCPFFQFEIVFAPQHGPITLALRGPDGVKAFLLEAVRANA